jgi:hypothetical protein
MFDRGNTLPDVDTLAKIMYEALDQGASWEGMVQDAVMDEWWAAEVGQWRKSAQAVVDYLKETV